MTDLQPRPSAEVANLAGLSARERQLHDWWMTQAPSFTEDALRASALAAGYTAGEIARALDAAAPPGPPIGPARAIAGVIVLATYGLVFALLSAGMVARAGGDSYGSGAAIAILAMTMVVGLVISLLTLLRRPRRPTRQAQVTSLVAIPLVLLLVIGGACVATGLPLPGPAL